MSNAFTFNDLTPIDREIVTTMVEALNGRKTLSIHYKGLPRVIEVHAVGVTTAGNPCMRVYQTDGISEHGDLPGWRMMTLDNVSDIEDLGIAAPVPREGYRRGDKGMIVIFEEL